MQLLDTTVSLGTLRSSLERLLICGLRELLGDVNHRWLTSRIALLLRPHALRGGVGAVGVTIAGLPTHSAS